jgi:FkbM family methyltransferase
MLNLLSLPELQDGINFIDIGSSGELDRYWKSLFPFMHLYAFDPNVKECDRLNQLVHQFASATYLPYAIAGSTGQFTLYETADPYCWSLLEPDQERLKRFAFGHKFEVSSTSQLQAKALSQVDELQTIDIDVIKSDTQGLELPILSNSDGFVNSAFIIEVETGFSSNYKGETTFDQISQFLREKHFRLFHINPNHRISRNNIFSNKTCYQEIIWCESLWIKDYTTFFKHNPFNLSRSKALKALVLCANHGCIDYGLELAHLFYSQGLLTPEELKHLQSQQAWYLSRQRTFTHKVKKLTQQVLRLLPNRILREISEIVIEVTHTDHPLKNNRLR